MSTSLQFARVFVGDQNFNDMIKTLPLEWRGAIVDVGDTLYFVNQTLMFKLGIEDPASSHPELFMAAVNHTFARHAEIEQGEPSARASRRFASLTRTIDQRGFTVLDAIDTDGRAWWLVLGDDAAPDDWTELEPLPTYEAQS